MKTIREQRESGVLTIGQRVGEYISAVITLCILGFFIAHHVAQTGFFPSTFGSVEMICFYSPMLLSIAAPLVLAVIGRRNPAHQVKVLTNSCMAPGAF